MTQHPLFIAQGQIRIQQIKVDARATGFFEGLVWIFHWLEYGHFPTHGKA